jgi:hypothetical protein
LRVKLETIQNRFDTAGRTSNNEMGLLTSILRKWRENIPWSIAVVVVSAPLATSVFGYCCLGSPGPQTTRSFLRTLATVQGSVLAIVFSVTLVAVQLTASRYSSRFATLYARSASFSFTFVLFAVSIGLIFVLLFNTVSVGTNLYRASLYFSGGLSVSIATSLYWFVNRLTYLSTPDGILDLFEQDLTTDDYHEQTRQSLADDNEPHPLRPLHAMSSGALESSEVTTAENAVTKQIKLTKHHHRRITESDQYNVESHQFEQELIKPVLKQHLSETVQTAADRGEYSLVRTAVQSQVNLAEYGMKAGDKKVVRNVRGTLNLESRRADLDSTVQTLDIIWQRYGDLLESAVDTGNPEIVRQVARGFGNQLPAFISPRISDSYFHITVEDSLRSLRSGIATVLEEHGEEINRSDFDWTDSEADRPHSDPGAITWYLFRYLKQLTSAILRYQENHGDDFVDSEQVLLHWEKLCNSAADEESGEFTSAVCRGMIELVLFYDNGATRLIHIGEKSPTYLATSFNEILAYDPEGTTSESKRFVKQYHDDKYYPNQIGHYQRPLNTREDFPKVVEQLRDKVMNEDNRQQNSE